MARKRPSYGAEELYREAPTTPDGRAYRRHGDGEAHTARRLPGTTSPATDQAIATGKRE